MVRRVKNGRKSNNVTIKSMVKSAVANASVPPGVTTNYVTRWSVPSSNIGSPGAIDVGRAFSFQLNDLPNYTELVNTYDFY